VSDAAGAWWPDVASHGGETPAAVPRLISGHHDEAAATPKPNWTAYAGACLRTSRIGGRRSRRLGVTCVVAACSPILSPRYQSPSVAKRAAPSPASADGQRDNCASVAGIVIENRHTECHLARPPRPHKNIASILLTNTCPARPVDRRQDRAGRRVPVTVLEVGFALDALQRRLSERARLRAL
jgi:hypothetical protein